MAETYLLAMRCPVFRRRDSHSGSRTELENLYGDGKGKGTSGEPARPKVPMRHPGADCFERANWQQEELQFSTEGGSLRAVARAG